MLDESAMARITWPREWPQEVADGLKPQKYIESDDPIFKKIVEDVSGGKLRFVPPYVAAKELVRASINAIQMSGDGVRMAEQGIIRGLEIEGARKTVAEGRGGPHDLLCVCIAVLRAAGIPARPVIGAEENAANRNVFVTWGEFYLPGAGWIPFDPDEMRGKNIRTLDVRQPWPEFGTMKRLNRRIPLAYYFEPPNVPVSPPYPGVWGWDPKPMPIPPLLEQIHFSIVSRGPGKEDPQ